MKDEPRYCSLCGWALQRRVIVGTPAYDVLTGKAVAASKTQALECSRFKHDVWTYNGKEWIAG